MNVNATFIGQMIVFAILLWFFWKFIVPPIAQAINDRQKKIAEGLAAAERGQRDLDEAKSRADAVVREARDRASQILDQANRRSNEMIDSAKQTASAEGERVLESARAEAESETSRARDQLRREVGALAVAGASRLLGREIDAKAHAQLLDQLAEEIARG
ncbi:MAG: ATP synthase subunit b [Steroidobacteraceae bacterium]|nr:ATP synthase subunit b [Steroidobacteraceae bacterium]